jgi:hypothetical protein
MLHEQRLSKENSTDNYLIKQLLQQLEKQILSERDLLIWVME